MTPFSLYRFIYTALVIALLIPAAPLTAQGTGQQVGFYEVQLVKEEVYTYTNLKFAGDYSSILSPAGSLALGRTEGGVTVVIILGGGEVTIQTPEAIQEKLNTVFGAYPLKASFKSLYMRLNPKEYDETLGKLNLVKAPSDEALAKAKELYDLKFLASYHAGPRAIFPPYKTRVFDFDTDLGQITYEEGYWLRLIRVSPYGKVYPSNFVNPKQKYGMLPGKTGGLVFAD